MSIDARKLSAVAHAEKVASPAKGTKTCTVEQYTSAYLYKRKQTDDGFRYGSDMSNLHARVFENGRVGLAVSEDTYPGTKAYFLIGGRRYSADGQKYAMLDGHGLESLKNDAVIDFSWTDWPSRDEINNTDVLGGFAAAYDDCRQFLGPR